MKRSTVIFTFMLFSLAIFLSSSLNTRPALAQNTSYTITSVDHQVSIMYSGHVVIQDTIQVTGQLTNGFLIGFPYKYGPFILKATAYTANVVLPMDLGVQLEDRSGFYGAKISFPQGSPQVFTVVFILSNNLVTPTSDGFSLDFPAYPSFITDVASCNVTLVLPSAATNLNVTKSDGTVQTTSFTKTNLAAFTYSPATATFSLPAGYIQPIEIQTLNRQITLNPTGTVTCSDSYRLINNSTGDISTLSLDLPANASNAIAKDQLGRTLNVALATGNRGSISANVTLILPVKQSESALLTLEYSLPSVAPEGTSSFTLNFDLFSYLNYYVDAASVTVVPPQGARFEAPTLSSANSSFSLSRDVFQEALSVQRAGVSYVDSLTPSASTFQVVYNFSPLWIPLWPTLWTWTLAGLGCIAAVIWKRPRAQAAPKIVVPKLSAGISPDQLGGFADAFEEKNRVVSELRALEYRAQKGKIPRRRYKVQRRTLEVRLNTLSTNINNLKELLRSAGGVYATLIRQLDTTEAEMDELETTMQNNEARQRRGELSLEEYKKLQSDYQRRKEKADTTVNGILLRLREEIR